MKTTSQPKLSTIWTDLNTVIFSWVLIKSRQLTNLEKKIKRKKKLQGITVQMNEVVIQTLFKKNLPFFFENTFGNNVERLVFGLGLLLLLVFVS